MVAVEQKIYYHRQVLAGEIIYISSEILEVKNKSIHFRHVMTKNNSNSPVSETELVGVHINRESRKSCEFPDNVYHAAVDIMNSKNLEYSQAII